MTIYGGGRNVSDESARRGAGNGTDRCEDGGRTRNSGKTERPDRFPKKGPLWADQLDETERERWTTTARRLTDDAEDGDGKRRRRRTVPSKVTGRITDSQTQRASRYLQNGGERWLRVHAKRKYHAAWVAERKLSLERNLNQLRATHTLRLLL
ncbi:hypothetical protein BV898_16843 [Hypsibius exemplaris]|uniref:Uncharacterized protein n=1 Tax=Hypsibius exemplaris TaxID=2072580 RepID=A0A9X6RM12_HYPEX|nr:hypothetical protein BV898_16843 [Hypsibius exemplaris]